MDKVLFIGDYFPHISYKSFLNNKLAMKLSEKYELILVSSAWNNIENEIYGDESTLSENKPFSKRYFLDPIQMKYSNYDIVKGYLAMCCRIIENYDINAIIYADKMQYILLIDLLKVRFNIPIYLLFYDINIYQCLDDYTVPFISFSISQAEKINMFLTNCDLFNKFLNIPKYLFEDLNVFSRNFYKDISAEINEVAILSAYLDQEKYNNLYRKLVDMNLPYPFFFVALKKAANLEIPKNNIVLYDDFETGNFRNVALFFEDEIFEQKHIAFSEIFLSFTLGKPCLLQKHKILQISQNYKIKSRKMTESLYALMDIS